MIILISFLLGVACGAVGLVFLTLHFGKKAISKSAENVISGIDSVTDRMKRIKEITNEQLDLMSRADGPQKNSLDGKYKNSLNRTVKDLEEEKTTILKSIITDGHDPEITTMDPDGTVVSMKLSEFMAMSGITVPPKKEAAPKSKQIGKFTVYTGGKDDGNNGNTTH